MDRRQIVIFFIFIIHYNLCFSRIDTINLSLQAAIEIALEHSPDVLIANYETQINASRLRESNYNYIPKIEGVAQYNRNLQRPVIFLPEDSPFGTVLEIGFDNAYSATLSASMPLLSPGLISSIKISRTATTLSQEALRGVKQQIILEVKKAYFNVLLAKEALLVMEQSVQNAIDNSELIRQMFNQGIVAEFDLIRAQVQVESIRPSLDQAGSNLAFSVNNLKRMMGIDLKNHLNITENLSLKYKQTTEVNTEEQIKNNSRHRQMTHQMELARMQVNLIRAGRLPSLSALGNFQIQAQANDFDFEDYNWVNTSVIGLQLRVPIFNGLIIQQQVRQTELALRQVQEQKRALESGLQTQLEHQIYLMKTAFSRISAQQKAFDLAKKSAEIARIRYETGTGNIIELNDASLAQTQSNLNLLQAIHEYNVAAAEYENLIGEL
jgi:outer membrane protein